MVTIPLSVHQSITQRLLEHEEIMRAALKEIITRCPHGCDQGVITYESGVNYNGEVEFAQDPCECYPAWYALSQIDQHNTNF